MRLRVSTPKRSRVAVGLFGALALGLASGCSEATDQTDVAANRPNLLFILVDTLRWDHLSTYGYARSTSPRIDALGEQGWVFENHISHAGQTVPATISMLISKYPVEHGFVHEGPGHFAKNPPYFGSELVFLGDVLRDAGYRTGGFVANPFLTAKHNFDQSFDHFHHERGRGEVLTRAALRWIEESETEAKSPFFAYLHLMDVHSPYEPPAPYAERYPKPSRGSLVYRNGPAPNASPSDLVFTVSLYDAQINYVDDLVAELLDGLEARGRLENTIVVLTADHGEEFLEHGGLGHGTSVYGELVNVPLIVYFPKQLVGGRRIDHITQHIDLAPTLLELMAVEKPQSFRGGSVLEPAARVYAENGEWRAAYAEGVKLVVNLETASSELYRSDDRLDQTRLDDAALEARLRAQLDSYLALAAERGEGATDSGASDWTDEEMENLRALGYAE